MSDHHLLGLFVRRFLLEEVVADRNLTRNTQRSYRDAIRLLFGFMAERHATDPTRVTVEQVTATVVRAFFGIHTLLARTVEKAAATTPSLKGKRVSPHTIRHTTAVHLLRAGVDINTIRAWLGHVSLETTNRYAEVDLEMKAAALETCAVHESEEPNPQAPHWHGDMDLMGFLMSL